MTVSDLGLSMSRAARDTAGRGHELGPWRVAKPGKEASAGCLVADCVLVVRITDAYAHQQHWYVRCPFTREYQDSLR